MNMKMLPCVVCADLVLAFIIWFSLRSSWIAAHQNTCIMYNVNTLCPDFQNSKIPELQGFSIYYLLNLKFRRGNGKWWKVFFHKKFLVMSRRLLDFHFHYFWIQYAIIGKTERKIDICETHDTWHTKHNNNAQCKYAQKKRRKFLQKMKPSFYYFLIIIF